MTGPPRLAVFPDFPAEGWPSMDLCAEMLLAHLPTAGPHAVAAERVCPPFRRLASRVPGVGRRPAAFNADRILNRFVHFPRAARRAVPHFDLFHVVDHTYAQLVHALPAARTGVFCYDLDAFRSVLEPDKDRRPAWFRRLAARSLAGLKKAAVVFHDSAHAGDELRRFKLVEEAKLRHVPLGVAAEFVPTPAGPPPALPWLDALPGPWVLHVGSCIPRKRIDVLLDVVAAVRTKVPDLRLVKVGGDWTADHRARIEKHNLGGAVVHKTGLAREELAGVYRRANAVLMTSDAEGFGLPVVEALACGAAVVASDIPPLREAGGPAAVYAPVADVPTWADVVGSVLAGAAPPRADRLAWAARFSWAAYADTIAVEYHRLLGR